MHGNLESIILFLKFESLLTFFYKVYARLSIIIIYGICVSLSIYYYYIHFDNHYYHTLKKQMQHAECAIQNFSYPLVISNQNFRSDISHECIAKFEVNIYVSKCTSKCV